MKIVIITINIYMIYTNICCRFISWRFILKFMAYLSLQYQAHSGIIDL